MAKLVKKGANSTDEVELNTEALEDVDNEENEEVSDGVVEEDGTDSDEEVEEEIKAEEAKEAKAPEAPKEEKVRIAKDLHCHIGGKFLEFKAGREYFVNQNIKSILRDAGYLSAL